MGRRKAEGEPVTIKKYANRRLYNTDTSSYITLDDLARLTREGTEYVVIDAKSGDDITRSILTQIIMEEEARGSQMLPLGFLRDIIGLYGNSMQAVVPGYLEASMAHFRENQSKFADMIGDGMEANPFARLAQTNMDMMRAAAEAFLPKDAEEASPARSDDLDALRDQMAAMQKRLDALDR